MRSLLRFQEYAESIIKSVRSHLYGTAHTVSPFLSALLPRLVAQPVGRKARMWVTFSLAGGTREIFSRLPSAVGGEVEKDDGEVDVGGEMCIASSLLSVSFSALVRGGEDGGEETAG